MIIRNPSGRTIKLEVLLDPDGAAMTLELGPRAQINLTRYQRALDAMAAVDEDGAGHD